MRYIRKSAPPPALSNWKAQGGSGYANLSPGAKEAVRLALLAEQGGICAYTGQRIAPKSGAATKDTMHIEHIEPQSVNPGRDTGYTNMVAAYPGEDYEHRAPGGRVTKSCPFGAHKRGNWWHATAFIHPLKPICETAFDYKSDGVILGNDADATTTIAKLNLNDSELCAWRAAACAEWKAKAERLSDAKLEAKIAQISEPASGALDAFCFVFKDVLRRELRRR